MDWLPWAPLCAAILHIAEEFLYPGGFAEWYRRYRNDPSRITARFLILVNAALLAGCIEIGLLGHSLPGIFYWLTIAAVMFSNGVWHAWASYKSHSYSPGTITGVIVYLPMAIYGFAHFLRTSQVPLFAALIACGLGGSYHLWSALYHRKARGSVS
jgi:hypothetical protein